MTSGTSDSEQFVGGDLESGADDEQATGAAALGDSGVGIGLDPSNASSFEPEEDAAAAETPSD